MATGSSKPALPNTELDGKDPLSSKNSIQIVWFTNWGGG